MTTDPMCGMPVNDASAWRVPSTTGNTFKWQRLPPLGSTRSDLSASEAQALSVLSPRYSARGSLGSIILEVLSWHTLSPIYS